MKQYLHDKIILDITSSSKIIICIKIREKQNGSMVKRLKIKMRDFFFVIYKFKREISLKSKIIL